MVLEESLKIVWSNFPVLAFSATNNFWNVALLGLLWPDPVPALSTTCLPRSELFCMIIKCTKHCPKSGARQMLLLCLNCSLSTVHLTGTETSFRSQLKRYFFRQVVLTAPSVLSYLKELRTVMITSHLAFMLIFFQYGCILPVFEQYFLSLENKREAMNTGKYHFFSHLLTSLVTHCLSLNNTRRILGCPQHFFQTLSHVGSYSSSYCAIS